MATNLRMSSGSIFAGNPITVACNASSVNNPTFHRVVFEVTVNGSMFKFSQPVITEGGQVQIDISSAIRAIFDDYEWTPNTTTPPRYSWNVKAYDEYMLDGEVYPEIEPKELLGGPSYHGGFNDLERITSGGSKTTTIYSRKPTDSPEIVCVGDTVCIPDTGSAPSSSIITVSTAGKHATANVFAITPVSRAQQRTTFRFINGFGCLESISAPKASQKTANYKSTTHNVTKLQTFSRPSHTIVRKQADAESWRFTSGPVDEKWQQWFLHEFLMAEHVWILLPSLEGKGQLAGVGGGWEGVGSWLRVHIIPEESITYIDEDKREVHEVIFQATFDIAGSPVMSV